MPDIGKDVRFAFISESDLTDDLSDNTIYVTTSDANEVATGKNYGGNLHAFIGSRPIRPNISAITDNTIESICGATEDKYGTFLYRLQEETILDGSQYINTGVKLFENNAAKNWTVSISYKGTPSSTYGYPLMLACCLYDSSAPQGFQIRQAASNEGWFVYAGSGIVRLDLAYDYTGKTYSELLGSSIHTITLVKNDDKYSIYLNEYLAYNAPLGYAFSSIVPENLTCILGARYSGSGQVEQYTNIDIVDARIYDAVLTTEQVTSLVSDIHTVSSVDDDVDTPTVSGSSNNIVYCWGDSLTEGVGSGDGDGFHPNPWCNQLRYPHINYGVQSEDIQTIMARQGADPIVLTNDITIPADKDTAVILGSCTKAQTNWEGDGLTTRSGQTVKPLRMNEAGVNPVSIGGVLGNLYREIATTYDNDSTYTYKFKRLTSGSAVTVSKGTEIETQAMRNCRNGYAVIWMGANGRVASHQEFAAKVIQMVEYGKYKNWICVICREFAEQWVEDGDGYQGIRSLLKDADGTDHLLYLPKLLVDRGCALAGLANTIDTSSWETDDIILKNCPKLCEVVSGSTYGYGTFHFSKYGYKAIGKLIDEKLAELINS